MIQSWYNSWPVNQQQIKCIVTAKTHFLAQHLKATTEGKNLVAISEIDLKHFNGNVAI